RRRRCYRPAQADPPRLARRSQPAQEAGWRSGRRGRKRRGADRHRLRPRPRGRLAQVRVGLKAPAATLPAAAGPAPAPFRAMSYAIVRIGGKQHRVQEGERLYVDRLPVDEGKTFHPDLLLLGGDGEVDFEGEGVQVTARVVRHALGPKVRIGKYKPKKGY